MAELPQGLWESLKYPYFDAMFNRRSRRFGLGMEIEKTALEYKSPVEPIPLCELEEALLVWAATGLTGLCLGDLPPRIGLSLLIQWSGRTWPTACNSHSTELFFTNDQGTYMVKLWEMLPESKEIVIFQELSPEAKVEKLLELYRHSLVKFEDGRADLPKTMPGLFDFNEWNANKPGTTLFIPITNVSVEYLNLLFLYLSPKYGFNIIDEVEGKSAGLDEWVRRGILREDRRISLYDLETRIITLLVVEQAIMCQNINLALQAMGLGGWTFTGLLAFYTLGGAPQVCKGLGFRFITPKKGLTDPPAPVPVGKDGLFEAYSPPYYKDMDEAVDAFLEKKCQSWGPDKPNPFRNNWEAVRLEAAFHPDPRRVEVVKSFCNYVYETYGRFPAYVDPMYMKLTTQAQHLDLSFYDRYYPPGAYSDTHRNHFKLWHPDIPDPFESG